MPAQRPENVLTMLREVADALVEREHLRTALDEARGQIALLQEALHSLVHALDFVESHGTLPRWYGR